MHILWLKTELLHPVDKGGRIRTYHMLKELKRQHHVTYLTLDDGSAADDAHERALEFCHELVCVPHRTSEKFSSGFYTELALNLISPLPYFMKKYKAAGMTREIAARVRAGDFDVLVCDFLQPSINVPQNLPFATVLFEHNVEAMIWRRHYEVQQNPLKKLYLYVQWRKSFSYERMVCRRFDLVVTVSKSDAETLKRDYGIAHVVDVPTAVDADYFNPGAQPDRNREPYDLVFTGSMDWLPNEDAIQYFTREIMPLIKRRLPDARLIVVGRKPYASLLGLSERDPSIIVTGRVADVRPYMKRASAYIVPIRIGGGTRLKIYEAMELPVISTTVGAEGLPLRDGVDLLLADTPTAFAEAVVRVLTDAPFAAKLKHQGRQTVKERFTWQGVAKAFSDFCERAAAAHFEKGKRHVDVNIVVQKSATGSEQAAIPVETCDK